MINESLYKGYYGIERETLRIIAGDEDAMLRIRDNCRNFDTVKYLELHQSDVPVAHIGIRMVMKLVKDAKYENSLGLNNLLLTL